MEQSHNHVWAAQAQDCSGPIRDGYQSKGVPLLESLIDSEIRDWGLSATKVCRYPHISTSPFAHDMIEPWNANLFRQMGKHIYFESAWYWWISGVHRTATIHPITVCPKCRDSGPLDTSANRGKRVAHNLFNIWNSKSEKSRTLVCQSDSKTTVSTKSGMTPKE